MKAITAKQAHAIAQQTGVDIDGDGVTFYATDANEKDIFCFDTKRERDAFISNHKND